MIDELLFFYSPSNCPYKNLAIENTLLQSVEENQKILLLYNNNPSIVFGRFQNPWKECQVSTALSMGVNLVRRQSGGGTVYHDLYNLNFCFIEGRRDFEKADNNNILLKALKNLGIDAYASGRSDLMVNIDNKPFKFSGSAFKQKKDRSFHHGTLLIDSKLEILNEILRSKQKVLNSKSIDSVRSNVINLKELNLTLTKESLIESIRESFKEFYKVDLTDLAEVKADREFLDQMNSFEWIYNQTPLFELKSSNSSCEVEIKVKKGIIQSLELQEDNVNAIILQHISDELIGKNILELNIRDFIKEVSSFFDLEEKDLNSVKTSLEKLDLFNMRRE